MPTYQRDNKIIQVSSCAYCHCSKKCQLIAITGPIAFHMAPPGREVNPPHVDLPDP